MYVQITEVCCKCGQEIPDKNKVHYLSLIDRAHPTFFVTDDGEAIMQPQHLWEYCLCDKCFNEFNNASRYPYKPL